MDVRTLLFTDLVDSTRLVERLGDARAAQAWAEHDRCARDLLLRHRGREIDRADGFFLLFDTPADAAGFALAYHQALAALGLEARAALHVGPVILRENAAEDIALGAKRIEVEGLAKPFCARLMGLACAGQTLLGHAARSALGEALAEGAEIESHGHYRLKGIAEPVEVFELGLRGRSAFAPPADTAKAYRVVRAGELWRPVREVRHNLAAERDAFVGRAAELHALASRLDGGVRLLTLLGPGGTGKTRLVRRYGHAWLGDWPGGIYFCDLAEARSLEGIFFAVAVALDVPLGKGDPGVQLGHAIAGRGRCLVILDNFEQVAEHAGATLGRWADRAADAAFVVTSRERLHLPGEAIFAVEPLPLQSDAITLFAARAQAQQPDFALGDANRAAVAEVVRLLDGLPLAIELAAARVRVFSPAQLVERLRDRFGLLAGARGAPARQATLKAAIDWSWDLLAPWEQAAFAQCSVFEGGFTIEAAEAVVSLAPWPGAPPPMDAVAALVDKSLLRTIVRAEHERYDIDEPYFGMYVSIHEYARERLRLSGAQAARAAEERHGVCFAAFGTEAAIEALSHHGGLRRRRLLGFEVDNLAAACHRAAARGDAEIALAACRAAWEALELQGPFAVAQGLASRVLAIEGIAASARATALWTRALVAWRVGDLGQGQAWLEEALALAREQGDRRREGTILGSIGTLIMYLGRLDEARSRQEAALVIQRDLGNRRGEGTVLGNLASANFQLGRMDEARAQYEQALAIHREVGNRVVEGSVLSNLAGLHYVQGRKDESRACCEMALAIHHEMGDRRSVGIVLGNLGILHHDQGRLDDARASHEAGLAIHRELGDRQFESTALANLVGVHRDQGRIGEAQTHCVAALAIAREVGNRLHVGSTLGGLGELLARQGQIEPAREAFKEGEALLREAGDRPELAKLLCLRGQAELAGEEPGLARAELAEADAMAAEMGVGADSELGRLVAALREALARQRR